MQWIAQDVPWHIVDTSTDKPWRDEDRAMSAPQTIATGESEAHVRMELHMHLLKIAQFNHVRLAGETKLHQAAADAILAGVWGVRIHGRYYRITEG